MENNENVIEFLTGSKTASVTFTNRRHITKIKKLYEKRPEDFVRYVENKDGSVYATIPLSWVKIGVKRNVSEEQKKAAGERMKQYWGKNETETE